MVITCECSLKRKSISLRVLLRMSFELDDVGSYLRIDDISLEIEELAKEYSGEGYDDFDDPLQELEDYESEEENDEIEEELGLEDIQWEESDMVEEEKVRQFHREGCGCCLSPDSKPCSTLMTTEEIREMRNQAFELESTELDLLLLGTIRACLQVGETTSCSHQINTTRKLSRFNPAFHGNRICMKTFLFINGIGRSRLKSLIKHYKLHGATVRVHGNKSRLPSSTVSMESVQYVVNYLVNYSTSHALVLPGRVPGFNRTDIKLLPSSYTKTMVWNSYKEAALADSQRAVSYTKFVELWNQLTPFIRVCKPMTDLCFTCQKNNNKVLRSANLPESEKSDVVKEHQQHLQQAMVGRNYYREVSRNLDDELRVTVDFTTTRDPCSYEGTMHYSFDYAQQILYPSNPLQPGPIYFKTPRKCGLFGVCCESIPRQVNYVIDESVHAGKGANGVLSYVHHFLEKHGIGETSGHFHADNCSGQNKNNCALWYMAWRVIHNLHKNIQYSFMIAGHTKFAPDWCFGLLKQRVRKTFVSSLYEIVSVIQESTKTGVNVAELAGLHSGRVLVPTYDWTTFLGQYFKPLLGIKKCHYFRFCSEKPGVVFFKAALSDEEQSFQLLKNVRKLPPMMSSTQPPIVPPKGLDPERKQYLYEQIRPFCKEGTENLVAPKPT